MRSATRSLAAPLLRHHRQLFRACSTSTPAKIRFRDLLRPELICGLNLLDIRKFPLLDLTWSLPLLPLILALLDALYVSL